jgi:hypothetical protein
MSDSCPSVLRMTFLVGGVLVILAAVLLACLVPCVWCPVCGGRPDLVGFYTGSENLHFKCDCCAGKGKVPLLKRWMCIRNARVR